MRRVLAVIGVGAVLALAACGGEDEEEPAVGGNATPTQEQTPSSGAGEATEEQTPDPDATPAGEGGGGAQTASEGKELFRTTCGGCHTLADAGTDGKVGPSLDEVQPDKERVASAIARGPGAMPDNLYRGADAEAVAEYVSSVAGKS